MSRSPHAANPRLAGRGSRTKTPTVEVRWRRHNDTWLHGEAIRAEGIDLVPGGAQNTVPVTLKFANGRAMIRVWTRPGSDFAGDIVKVNGKPIELEQTAERWQGEVPLEVAMGWYANARDGS